MNGQDAMLRKVDEYSFMVTELQLFLDTHPDNASAYAALVEAIESRKQAVRDYENHYGPLTIDSHRNRCGYDWLATPWPWE